MRKISLVLVAVMFLVNGSIFANSESVKVERKKSLTIQVSEILQREIDDLELDFVNITADVKFTLNKNREIVVLYVSTKDSEMEHFVKSTLNYKKVDLENYREGRVYSIPVLIQE